MLAPPVNQKIAQIRCRFRHARKPRRTPPPDGGRIERDRAAAPGGARALHRQVPAPRRNSAPDAVARNASGLLSVFTQIDCTSITQLGGSRSAALALGVTRENLVANSSRESFIATHARSATKLRRRRDMQARRSRNSKCHPHPVSRSLLQPARSSLSQTEIRVVSGTGRNNSKPRSNSASRATRTELCVLTSHVRSWPLGACLRTQHHGLKDASYPPG